jgi:diphosphomevalonate decarboxylase
MATATARANLALVKYWGKRDATLNLPAAGSLSLTLDRLRTRTSVELHDGPNDELLIDGQPQSGKALSRISRFADLVRGPLGRSERIRVVSHNEFPTAAGLASSASAFAALAVAVPAAFEVELSDKARSILARRGSGSAARSIFGGFVRMNAGAHADGSDAYAEPLAADCPMHAVIAVAQAEAKKIGSTDGMEHTRATSPYHAAWLQLVERDLGEVQVALQSGDWDHLALLVEGNCLAMHADAMAARPGVLYFRPPTLLAIEAVRSLRQSGTPVFFTIDAGPHVVAFTPPSEVSRIAAHFAQLPGLAEVLTSGPGAAAQLEITP